MSVNYASGLSYYANKGVCGQPEFMDCQNDLEQKLNELYQLMRLSKFTVIHTGAGISTSSGIPDFRGPNGVWTMEQLGKQPCQSVTFEDARPSSAHRILVDLERHNLVQYLVTQNIDGLHLRSGFPRDRLSILHGDMFIERCSGCGTLYARSTPSPTMGLKRTGALCTYVKSSSRPCRGKLFDTILDWENDLPDPDYSLAIEKSKQAELHICIGTSLQMYPAASLPLLSSRLKRLSDGLSKKEDETHSNHGSKIVIINLQKTKLAKRAWLNIHAKADVVLSQLASRFATKVPLNCEDSPKSFTPTIVLRSEHSSLTSDSPWHILRHPTAGDNVRIIERWSDLKFGLNPTKFNNESDELTEYKPEVKRGKTEQH